METNVKQGYKNDKEVREKIKEKKLCKKFVRQMVWNLLDLKA